MQKEQTGSGVNLTSVTSLAAGAAIAMAVCLALMALCAWLIAGGRMGESWTARAGLIGAFVGCLIGGGYAIRCIRSRALVVGLAVSGSFLLLWLLAGLLFPNAGGAAGPFPLILSSLLGGGLSGILFATGKKRKK